VIIEIPDLTSEEAGTIVITAAEGGIGYWSQIQPDPGYRYTRWMPDLPDGSMGEPISVPDDFVFYRISPLNEDEDGYDEDTIFDITPALVRRGLELAMTQARHDLVRDVVLNSAREDWTGEIDADGADVIIQLGCYGEIIWG
jgi:hypothetical protein